MKEKLKIYLAGPDVFLPNAIEIGKKKKELCEKYGFEGLFPLDNEIDCEKLNLFQMGMLIFSVNENLIKSSDIVLANLTPFRGVNADVGTIWEVGCGRGNNKKLFGYSNTELSHNDRLKLMYGKDVEKDSNNMSFENFQMVENLMIDGSIISSGGKIIVGSVPKEELYTSLVVFEKCLEEIKKEI